MVYTSCMLTCEHVPHPKPTINLARMSISKEPAVLQVANSAAAEKPKTWHSRMPFFLQNKQYNFYSCLRTIRMCFPADLFEFCSFCIVETESSRFFGVLFELYWYYCPPSMDAKNRFRNNCKRRSFLLQDALLFRSKFGHSISWQITKQKHQKDALLQKLLSCM